MPVHKAAGRQRKEPHLFHSEKKKKNLLRFFIAQLDTTKSYHGIKKGDCLLVLGAITSIIKAEVILPLHPITAQHQTDHAGMKIFELLPLLPELY